MTAIEAAFRGRTPRSAELTDRAAGSLPGGSTRTFGYHRPYSVVFERGSGSHLWDVDGNRYVDLLYNGLSLIHGHAYEPALAAVSEALPNGTAWPGTSELQIAFAEALCERIPTADRVRFTNTGTEATMNAVKVARHHTGRPLILKSRGAYHGSYDDLEAGLYGIGELAGRTVLGQFGDLDSFEQAFADFPDQIAAVVIEPILFTFEVIPPPPGFLEGVIAAARRAGALVILDDCLMFRLAEAGSAQKYRLEPDLTCLGKFIGGGLPLGVIAGREEIMSVFDPRLPGGIYHGGSFNGNPLGCAAGRVTLEHLTAEAIAAMDSRAERLVEGLRELAAPYDLPFDVSGDGSVLGVYIKRPDGELDREAGVQMQLAASNHGVYFGQDGEMALATCFTDADVDEVLAGMNAALADLQTVLQEGAVT